MKTQLARLQQRLSTQAEIIRSLFGEMSILSREAADCREVTNLLLSMILEESDPLASTNPKLASVYECYPPKRLDPRRLP